jgi:hypothetical protein
MAVDLDQFQREPGLNKRAVRLAAKAVSACTLRFYESVAAEPRASLRQTNTAEMLSRRLCKEAVTIGITCLPLLRNLKSAKSGRGSLELKAKSKRGTK